jgi:hypothetical protein
MEWGGGEARANAPQPSCIHGRPTSKKFGRRPSAFYEGGFEVDSFGPLLPCEGGRAHPEQVCIPISQWRGRETLACRCASPPSCRALGRTPFYQPITLHRLRFARRGPSAAIPMERHCQWQGHGRRKTPPFLSRAPIPPGRRQAAMGLLHSEHNIVSMSIVRR